jgi:hypothetical protein
MTDSSPATPKPAKDDDRNLVAAENAAAPTVEDRLLVFWKNYRSALVWAIGAALLLIVAREGWGLYRDHQDTTARTAFGAAETPEQKAAFAAAHPGHPLAALALLAVADDAFAKDDFATAATRYNEAAAASTEPLLAARARLGEGIATIRAGSGPKGAGILQALAKDAAVSEPLRCEAWLHLAATALAEGDHAEARDALDQLTATSPTGIWTGRADFLRSQLPPEPEPAPAAPAP